MQTRFNPMQLEQFSHHIYEHAIVLIAKGIAEQYLHEHAQEILAALDPVAVANLAIADSGAGIREALHKKLPDKIVTVVKRDTEVYQRGIFGGMKRIG